MNILIVYGTTEGQTAKISRFLKSEAEKSGHQVTLYNAIEEPPSPEDFDLVLVGASVHHGKYQSAILHYVKEHRGQLNAMASSFFSVSLSPVSQEEASQRELASITEKFLEETGWTPARVEQVAGALLYTKYDFFKRFVMRLIVQQEGGETDTSQDYEYTDWAKLRTFLDRTLQGA